MQDTTTQTVDFTPLLKVLVSQERVPVTFFVPTLGKRTGTVVANISQPHHVYSRRFGDEESPVVVMRDFWQLVDRGWTASQINAELHRRTSTICRRYHLAKA